MTDRKLGQTRGPCDHVITQAALDASPDCIKIIGLDGRLKHMNRAGCAALGVDSDHVEGIDWVGLLPPQVHVTGHRSLASAARGEEVRFYGLSEGEGVGLRRWDNMLTPLRTSSNSVDNILCISREIATLAEVGRAPIREDVSSNVDKSTGIGGHNTSQSQYKTLSFRERECLFWTGLGKTAWEVSIILGLSRRTIEFHIANATRKLQALNKYHAAMIAIGNDFP